MIRIRDHSTVMIYMYRKTDDRKLNFSEMQLSLKMKIGNIHDFPSFNLHSFLTGVSSLRRNAINVILTRKFSYDALTLPFLLQEGWVQISWLVNPMEGWRKWAES